MSLVFEIVNLQEIDDQLAAVHAAIASVRERLVRSPELDDARRQLEHVEQRMAQYEKNQRRLEGQVADLSARIDPEENRLFSGSVTSTKELMSIQQELEVLKRKRSALEDELLEIMGRLETLERRRTVARQALDQAQEARRDQEEQLRAELQRHESTLAGIEQRRTGQAAQVEARPLKLYEDLRKKKGGSAVARLQGQACGSCRVGLPDTVRKQVLLRESIVQCPNCEKILAPG